MFSIDHYDPTTSIRGQISISRGMWARKKELRVSRAKPPLLSLAKALSHQWTLRVIVVAMSYSARFPDQRGRNMLIARADKSAEIEQIDVV